MTRFYLILSSLLVLAPTDNQRLEQVSKRLRITNGLRVDFSQETLTLRNKTRHTEGQAFFDADGRFRWTVKQKDHEDRIVIYNKKNLIEYIPAEKTASSWSTTTDKTQEISQIVAIVKSLDSLRRGYRITNQQFTADRLLLKLIPRTTNNISEIELQIALSKNFIETVKITNKNKKYSKFTFTNPQRRDFGDKPFVFSPARGTKVNNLN